MNKLVFTMFNYFFVFTCLYLDTAFESNLFFDLSYFFGKYDRRRSTYLDLVLVSFRNKCFDKHFSTAVSAFVTESDKNIVLSL